MSEVKSVATPWELSGLCIWGHSPWNANIMLAAVTKFSPMNGVDSEGVARLMLAAPDLLDACERAEFWLSTVPESKAISDVLRAAISRATQPAGG